MNTISFITANFVARELGYQLTEGWHQGNNATNDYYRPIDTFPKRFDNLLKEIKRMGFDSIDLWVAHLHWAWATKEHTKIANSLIAKHRLQVSSMAGNFGSTPLEFEAACQLANAMEVRLLAGSASILFRDRKDAIDLLRKYSLEFALVNQKEASTEQLLAKIGTDNHNVLGIAIDTGWLHNMGADLLEFIEELAPNLKLVQLKNLQDESGKLTATFDKGIIPIRECVEKLKEIRFNGTVSVEHHPFDRNPGNECRQNLELLKSWLS